MITSPLLTCTCHAQNLCNSRLPNNILCIVLRKEDLESLSTQYVHSYTSSSYYSPNTPNTVTVVRCIE